MSLDCAEECLLFLCVCVHIHVHVYAQAYVLVQISPNRSIMVFKSRGSQIIDSHAASKYLLNTSKVPSMLLTQRGQRATV